MTGTIHKSVNDLGVAAYLLMHGYTVIGKHGRAIYFECHKNELESFEKLIMEYQPPNEFYTFDSCLMFLKKINDYVPAVINEKNTKVISDLGSAAYLLMLKYRNNPLDIKIIGKKGRYIYFEFPEGKLDEFERMCYQYLPSPFQAYDSNLMALKKIDEYMPSK